MYPQRFGQIECDVSILLHPLHYLNECDFKCIWCLRCLWIDPKRKILNLSVNILKSM